MLIIQRPQVEAAEPEGNLQQFTISPLEPGRGYLSAERNKRTATIGVIPVDAIFSPVRRVAFSVEPTRVEQATNYDKLTLEIETDGSISPRDALASAGDTLRNLVALVAD